MIKKIRIINGHFGVKEQSVLEKLENLEQLRFLSSGHVIAVGVVDHPVQGIDTADDYRAFVKRTLSR